MKFIFVVGYPRSGTTLIADLLGRVTGYAVTPESRFYEENKYWWDRKKTNIVEKLEKKVRLKDFFTEFSSVLDGKLISKGEVLKQILTAFALQHSDGSGVIEKSPVHVFHIDEIHKDFAGAKIFAIVRDPYFAIKSWEKTPWKKKPNMWLQLEWNYRNNIIKNSKKIDKIVTYEQLLQDPMESLSALMEASIGVINKSIVRNALNADRKSTAVPAWEKAWKNNVNGPLLMNKQKINNKVTLRFINPNLAADFGYDQYKRSAARSLVLNLLSKFLIGGYRLGRSIYYQLRVNALLNKANEGESPIT